MEFITGIVVLLYLLLESIWDVKKRSISLAAVIAVSVFGAVKSIFIKGVSVPMVLFGLLPGLFLILAAFVTREKIGYGDGFVMLGLGMLLGVRSAFFVLLVSLFLCAIWSVALMAVGKVNRRTVLPFVPFYLVPSLAVFFLKS